MDGNLEDILHITVLTLLTSGSCFSAVTCSASFLCWAAASWYCRLRSVGRGTLCSSNRALWCSTISSRAAPCCRSWSMVPSRLASWTVVRAAERPYSKLAASRSQDRCRSSKSSFWRGRSPGEPENLWRGEGRTNVNQCCIRLRRSAIVEGKVVNFMS